MGPPRPITSGSAAGRAIAAMIVAALLWVVEPIALFFLFFGDASDRHHDPRDHYLPYFFAGTLVVSLLVVALAASAWRRRPANSITAVLMVSPWLLFSGVFGYFALLRAMR